MAFITEDGTGLATADSYISLDDADIYHENRANTAWAALDDDDKEAALRSATEYMDAAYAWVGARMQATQALGWPRFGVVVDGVDIASDAVPVAIQRACAELALRASTAALAPDVARVKLREKVGPIEVEYANGSPYTSFRQIDLMLQGYTVGGGRGAVRFVVRA